MRQFSLLAILLFALLTCGCDALRSLAGRPTSADIRAKREAIERQKAAQDSLREVRAAASRAAEKEKADSLASLEGLRSVPRVSSDRIGLSTRPSLRYYIMVGMYSTPVNALRAADLMESRGYPAEVIVYKSGKNAVGICGSNKIGRLYESFRRFSAEPFCPSGVWILVNE